MRDDSTPIQPLVTQTMIAASASTLSAIAKRACSDYEHGKTAQQVAADVHRAGISSANARQLLGAASVVLCPPYAPIQKAYTESTS